MKKLLLEHSTFDRVFKIERNIEKLNNEISEFEQIRKRITKVCSHQTKNGKTIIFVLNCGLIELHEILSKDVIYMNVSIRKKKEFEKIKKELEKIND